MDDSLVVHMYVNSIELELFLQGESDLLEGYSKSKRYSRHTEHISVPLGKVYRYDAELGAYTLHRNTFI